MGQTGHENERQIRAAGHCKVKLPGCRGVCCNCEMCIAAKGGPDICSTCAAATKKK